MNKKIALIASVSCLVFAPSVQSHLYGALSDTDLNQPVMKSSELQSPKAAVANDTQINQDLKKLIDSNDTFAGITADSKEGVVTLSGTIDSQKNKDDLLAQARGVAGVKDIVDNITLSSQ